MHKYRIPHAVVCTKDGFKPQLINHVCGFPLISCVKCHKAFCIDCDFMIHDIDKCCIEARDQYYFDNGTPDFQLKCKKNDRSKVEIQEVGDGNL